MLTNLWAKSLFLFLISSKKFQAKTKAQSGLPFILSLDTIGIFMPGKYLPCLSLLSSIIHSISLEIPKKFKAVVALAGDPYPIILLFLLLRLKMFFLKIVCQKFYGLWYIN